MQMTIDKNTIDAVPEGIPGWMSDIELAWLSERAKEMQTIVELGSHKGRSANVLLQNCHGPVYCIDLWDGNIELVDNPIHQPIFDSKEVFDEFRKNVGHYPNLNIIKSDSVRAAEQFPDKSIDFVFIDADHSYEGCKKDIEAWLPKCKKLIAGHDYDKSCWPGVVHSVNEVFGEETGVIGTIWYKFLQEAQG